MSLPEFDLISHSLIDSSKLDDFLKLSNHMTLLQKNLNEWFTNEEK